MKNIKNKNTKLFNIAKLYSALRKTLAYVLEIVMVIMFWLGLIVSALYILSVFTEYIKKGDVYIFSEKDIVSILIPILMILAIMVVFIRQMQKENDNQRSMFKVATIDTLLIIPIFVGMVYVLVKFEFLYFVISGFAIIAFLLILIKIFLETNEEKFIFIDKDGIREYSRENGKEDYYKDENIYQLLNLCKPLDDKIFETSLIISNQAINNSDSLSALYKDDILSAIGKPQYKQREKILEINRGIFKRAMENLFCDSLFYYNRYDLFQNTNSDSKRELSHIMMLYVANEVTKIDAKEHIGEKPPTLLFERKYFRNCGVLMNEEIERKKILAINLLTSLIDNETIINMLDKPFDRFNTKLLITILNEAIQEQWEKQEELSSKLHEGGSNHEEK